MSAPLNARDAKCCCECRHWVRNFWEYVAGECRQPERRVGMVFQRADGSEREVEWQVTGQYATCNLWEGK